MSRRLSYLLCFSAAHPNLHSFPTRRSSDLSRRLAPENPAAFGGQDDFPAVPLTAGGCGGGGQSPPPRRDDRSARQTLRVCSRLNLRKALPSGHTCASA